MSDRLFPDVFGDPFFKNVPFLYHVLWDPLISLFYHFGDLRLQGTSANITTAEQSPAFT